MMQVKMNGPGQNVNAKSGYIAPIHKNSNECEERKQSNQEADLVTYVNHV